MSRKILIVTASHAEAEVVTGITGENLKGTFIPAVSYLTEVLVTGVGAMATAWSLQQWIRANDPPALAVNVGIAGTYRDIISIGDVVMPVTDCFADSGIEDGKDFMTLHEAGLAGKNDFPFRNGLLYTDASYRVSLAGMVKPVNAITVNTATGSDATRDRLVAKYNPDIETMEGATFFYICLRENIPFFSLRAVSNIVETRNRSNWNIQLALDNLSEKLKDILLNVDLKI
ncbi:MAG TPA: futalosine hydrolase [Bacteroidales bacterium]|nr:futalosine hydrolase [Bacteroidales bacterium]